MMPGTGSFCGRLRLRRRAIVSIMAKKHPPNPANSSPAQLWDPPLISTASSGFSGFTRQKLPARARSCRNSARSSASSS